MGSALFSGAIDVDSRSQTRAARCSAAGSRHRRPRTSNNARTLMTTEDATHRPTATRVTGSRIATAVIAVLAAMFVHMLATNPVFQWDFMVENMFSDAVLRGARTTLIMTVLAMAIGILLGIVLAVMRLSANPVVSGAAWVYIWFFRAIPRIVLLFFSADHRDG